MQVAQIYDNSPVCSRIYESETMGYVILWKSLQIRSCEICTGH